MTESRSVIPVLGDRKDYGTWKKEVMIWTIGTAATKKQQASKLIMMMDGKARETAINIDPTLLNSDDGVANLFKELDALYNKDSTQNIIKAIDDFESYRRSDREDIDAFIQEFSRRYKRLQRLRDNKALYDDAVLAIRLLNQASLNAEQKRLIKATCQELTYKTMVEQLRKAYGDGFCPSTGDAASSSAIKVKPEENHTFFQQNAPNSQPTAQWSENSAVTFLQPSAYSPAVHPIHWTRGFEQPQQHRYSPYTRGGRGANKGYRKNPTHEYKDKVCFICQEPGHFVQDCKYNNHPAKGRGTEKQPGRFSFFQSEFDLPDEDEEITFLMRETVNKALLDTGASQTVCGEVWLKVFEESLSETDRQEISREACHKNFRFGDGDAATSKQEVTIPVTICGDRRSLKVYVVPNDVPLLLSRKAMKEMDMVIDLPNDQITIGNMQQEVILTESGHQVISIGRCEDGEKNNSTSMYFVNPDDAEKCAKHLHRYFAHSPAEKISKFVSQSDFPNKKIICQHLREVEKSCDFCLKHKSRETPHRKIGMPLGCCFNDVVAMDLKKLSSGDWIVHFVDTVTRFSVACPVKDKSAEEILTKTFISWISVFGRPNCFISDNGGEFVNQQFAEMCQLMDIMMKTSPAESPWCNGTVERHNGLLGQMIEAIIDETKCNLNIAVSWATNAKNSLNNVWGFSPHQLVFGQNPKIPSLLNEEVKLSMLNEHTVSKIVADHLTALTTARKKFVELENSNRLKRALQDRVYEAAADMKYVSGDRVYFKRSNQKKWNGPAMVVGHLANQVLIKQGGLLVRVHPCKVKLKAKADGMIACGDRAPREEEAPIRPAVLVPTDAVQPQFADNDASGEEVNSETLEHNTADQRDETDIVGQDSGWVTLNSKDVSTKIPVKVNDIIRYRDWNEDTWKEARVTGRAGKATSEQTRNQFNIQENDSDQQCSVDFQHFEVQKRSEVDQNQVLIVQDDEHTSIFALGTQEPLMIKEAKDYEVNRLEEFGVYDEVKDTGQNYVSSRWVITPKGENKMKARLVARGFEELCYGKKDSPTVTKPVIRIMFSIAAAYTWNIEALDITSAFLQAKGTMREVYVKPPADIRKRGLLWKLKKPLYGLGDSARRWYTTLKDHMQNVDTTMSVLDQSLFMYYENNRLQGLTVMHVDDIMNAGSTRFKKTIVKSIHDTFKVGKSQTGDFIYIGWNIRQEKDCILVDQNQYAASIVPVELSVARRAENEDNLSEEECIRYQNLLGKLMWISSQTRPDLSFETLEHSTHTKCPKIKHLKTLNKVVKRLDSGPSHVSYRKLDMEHGDIQLLCFSDASLGNLSETKSSVGGYLIFLTDGSAANLIAWSATKVKRVVHSIFAAETLACVDGTAMAIYIRQLLSEILFKEPRTKSIPITAFTDSKQLYDCVNSTSQCADKRLVLDIAELQQALQRKDISNLHWIPTPKMLADGLTKRGVNCGQLNLILETGLFNLEEFLSL